MFAYVLRVNVCKSSRFSSSNFFLLLLFLAMIQLCHWSCCYCHRIDSEIAAEHVILMHLFFLVSFATAAVACCSHLFRSHFFVSLLLASMCSWFLCRRKCNWWRQTFRSFPFSFISHCSNEFVPFFFQFLLLCFALCK